MSYASKPFQPKSSLLPEDPPFDIANDQTYPQKNKFSPCKKQQLSADLQKDAEVVFEESKVEFNPLFDPIQRQIFPQAEDKSMISNAEASLDDIKRAK